MLMGILNITPDSFSDGGKYLDLDQAVEQALKMEDEGADIIDIGGESSRPGSTPVHLEEELKRVIPVVQAIRKQSKIKISIDTTKAEVARQALDQGANMINDISAARFDSKMLEVVKRANVPICLMHMQGTPQNMQISPSYNNVIKEIKKFLQEAINRAEQAGISSDKILIDPGIGFGKTAQDNLVILKNLHKLSLLDKKIVIGISRKSFIGKMLGLEVKQRLEASLATLFLAFQNGATVFRVHDVGPSKRFLDMVQLLNI
ncbi:MAG: dihydropteroate synthase [Pseudomonadota bacterium]